MDESFRIDSRENQASVELRAYDDTFFLVEIRSRGLQATARVSSYQSVGLPKFFNDLAAHWRGWSGEKAWQSCEGEFVLRAESDRTGHVFLTAALTDGAPARWEVSAVLTLEAGQLEHLAAEARAFERSSVRIV